MRISYLLQVTMHRRDSPNCTGRDKSFSFQYRGDDSGEHFNLKSTETSSITNSKALKLKCNSSDFICCVGLVYLDNVSIIVLPGSGLDLRWRENILQSSSS